MSKKETYGDRKIHKHPKANTAGFAQNPENINRKGRPRKMVSGVIIELKNKGVEKVSQSDVKDVFLMLINLETNEIKEIINDEKQPAIIRIVGREMLSGKGFDIIEKMLDRAIGKADENVKHDHSINWNITKTYEADNKTD